MRCVVLRGWKGRLRQAERLEGASGVCDGGVAVATREAKRRRWPLLHGPTRVYAVTLPEWGVREKRVGSSEVVG